MGTTVSASGQVLGPSDSVAMTAEHITERVAAGDTRYQGAGYSADDIPIGKNPAHYRLESGSLVHVDTLYTIDSLKVAAYDYINTLNAFSVGAEGDESRLWPSSAVADLHDLIARLHLGAGAILMRRTTQTATLTLEQRIKWCRQGSRGPSEVRSFNAATQQIQQIRALYQVVSQDAYTVPTVPVAYVDPRGVNPIVVGLDATATLSSALGLTNAITFTGDNAVDAAGDWIDRLRA